MKLPLSWLREYVAVEAPAEEIAERLTFSGTEVEGIEHLGAGCEDIIVGEIRTVTAHPKADRLRLCRVFNGTDEVPVVCGADNVEVGAKAAFAPLGATLPDGMTIKQAKLRGEISQGMLCAEDELGLSSDHGGIMLLPPETVAGTPLLEVLGGVETVLELEVTWNRSDCLSVIGMAREVAALYGVELKVPQPVLAESGKPVAEWTRVEVADAADCPRYTARVLTGAVLKPSPLWMRRRLSCCGVRPINNVVDITNYVMLECGQPLHAFDFAMLTDSRIVVRRAATGERMATLDDEERELTSEMLVIADAERPVAVAGIMGGAGSEIGDSTQTVLLESATFDPALTHRASVALGLSTDASHRFERTVDRSTTEWASRRAAVLMSELADAAVAPGMIDVQAEPETAAPIACRLARLRAILGVPLEHSEVLRILTALQIPAIDAGDDVIHVVPPSFRPDLKIEADLIEEVIRVHGLDELPAADPIGRIVVDADDARPRAVAACRDHLVGLGLSEIMNYSFLSSRALDRFGREGVAQRVELLDPVSADHGVMRDSLIPQMAESLGRNVTHQELDAACFEIGRVFFRENGAIGEEDRLAIGIMGRAAGSSTGGAPVTPEATFLRLKGVLEELARVQNVRDVAWTPGDDPAFETGWCVALSIDGVVVGRAGLLTADIRHNWRIQNPVALMELKLDSIISQLHDTTSFTAIPVYPSVARDLAVIVDEAVQHGDILRVINSVSPEELTDIGLFDIFRSKEMGNRRKSMAYTLTYRSAERTLTDEETNSQHAAIMDRLREELGAEIKER
ncbi:MAG: phenylalanine--tRNA ligase subunit beta [Verrucomicrobia bacterium]|jgi:phenylalanyl-tRNA synthetase beta chain|nr:phenylalanine--tRNA ligase subunit beta [Verrucomicrobiota bacterium]MBT7067522.1 phenylalanine--tRNA ligase subunit beta [Verrucomicrobiota bacterium]MBT7699087.1 phenylalanine--tRNA ligase subunit beta [Verrucomicrobiota bacterium]